jgi:uncharacterized membrane protein YiaA
MFVGFCLLIVGTWLYLFEITQGGKFLAVMGLVYFGISVVLTLIHDRHMAKRTRARRE